MSIRIERRRHHYREEVQGISLLHAGIVSFLLDSITFLRGTGEAVADLPSDRELQRETVDRLRDGAPLVAVVGGSGDHPAHAGDRFTMSRVALSLWRQGAIPGAIYLNAVCDGVAQSMPGMRMSLWSRNATAASLITQLSAHGYDALIALASCDKHPLGILAGAAQWARWQVEAMSEPEPWMACIPAHVLEGGSIPPDTAAEIAALIERARASGRDGVADDLAALARQRLQCITVQAFQGAFLRLEQAGLLEMPARDRLERCLGAAASGRSGGICEFRGTGNTDRMALAAYGLVPSSVQALLGPPTQTQVDGVVSLFLAMANRPEMGLRRLLLENSFNALAVHAAMSGSTNNMMHMPYVHAFLGFRSSVFDLEEALAATRIPGLMTGFSLLSDVDRGFAGLARQCCGGESGGIDTLMRHLTEAGVPVRLDAPTISGTWRERLIDPATGSYRVPSVDAVPEPRRILTSTPDRNRSGHDGDSSGVRVFTGSAVGRSAVLKIAGLSREEEKAFNDRVALVVFLSGEEEAAEAIGDEQFLEKAGELFSESRLRAARRYNAPNLAEEPGLSGIALFRRMAEEGSLRLLIVIAGEGPLANGMPEVHKPQDWVSRNRRLAPLCCLLTDARFSGTNYGPALGHAEPEALAGGVVGWLADGDPVWVRLSERRIDLLDSTAFDRGEGPRILSEEEALAGWAGRESLHEERLRLWKTRRAAIPPSVRIPLGSTTAAEGVVPPEVWEAAGESWEWEKWTGPLP